jgi:hypothetical protein
MRIKQIKQGIIPAGPGIGSRAVFVIVDKDVEDLTPEASLTKIRTELVEEVYSAILEGRTHVAFLASEGSGCISDEIHRTSILDFISTDFSKAALHHQTVTLGRRANELTPPFMQAFVNGSNFTTNERWYEYFNYVVCTLEPTAENSSYNDFALIEITTHRFSTIMVKVRDAADIVVIQKMQEDGILTGINNRIQLVPVISEAKQACEDAVMTHGFRFGFSL